MDLKICIWFILLLAIGQARGYIKCLEMQQETEKFEGKSCTVEEINEDYFLRNEFYNKASGDKIQNLHISSKLSDIPEGIRNRFSHVTGLDLDASGLNNLQKKSLDRVPATVQELKMSHCNFTTLSENMFTSVNRLRLLDVSNGTIDHIHDKAFAKLTELRELRLNDNHIVTITKEMFDELPKLVSLDLSNNLLNVVMGPGILAGCPVLEQLKLSNNHLTTIMDYFTSSNRLNELSLSDNHIAFFDTRPLVVDQLNIDGNYLTEFYIPEHLFALNAERNNISRLTCAENLLIRNLKLARNSISSMDCIGNTSTLMSLDMTYNNIGKLNSSTFEQLTELRELRIGHTNITNFVPGVLNQQDQLEVLDLSYNRLGDFPIKIIKHLKQLKTLYIDGNDMTKIPHEKISTTFKSLQVLGIGENNLDCTELIEMFVILKQSLPGCQVIAMSHDDTLHKQIIRGVGCDPHNSTIPKPIPDLIMDILKDIETLKTQMAVFASDRSSDSVLLIIWTVIVAVILVGALTWGGYTFYLYKKSPGSTESSQGSLTHRTFASLRTSESAQSADGL